MNVLVQSYNVKLSKVERRMSNLSRICIRCNYKWLISTTATQTATDNILQAKGLR